MIEHLRYIFASAGYALFHRRFPDRFEVKPINIPKVRKLAKRGNAEAQRQLGEAYGDGHCVRQNSEEAIKWFLKAAEQGNVKAHTNLGYAYTYGRGSRLPDHMQRPPYLRGRDPKE